MCVCVRVCVRACVYTYIGPARTDSVAPAGSFVDFRPDGLRFATPVDVALAYHSPPSGSKRLFIFTYNDSARAWQRHTAHASLVDPQARLVRTKLEHFSVYAVMLQDVGFTPPPSPSAPAPLPGPSEPGSPLPIVVTVGGVGLALVAVGVALWQVLPFFRDRRELHVYIHASIHPSIHAYIQVLALRHRRRRPHICIHTHTHKHTHAQIHRCIHTGAGLPEQAQAAGGGA